MERSDPVQDVLDLAAVPYRAGRLEEAAGKLACLSPDDLDRAVEALDLVSLFRRAPRPQADRILALLSRDRVADLSVPARAAVVDALQPGSTPRRYEEAIRDCFLATRGAALSCLKRAIDGGRSRHDLAELLFRDIDSDDLRLQILDHLDREGRRVPHRELKILSDLDDTLYANWKDRRYPPKTVYPGVRQLYRELDQGSEERPSPLGDVTFLTGRPGGPFGFLEDRYHRNLGTKGLEETVLLTGTMLHQFAHGLIFSRKWANFELYQRLYPDFDLVLFGDSGQADPALLAAAGKAHPDRVRAALIHDVVATPAAKRQEWAGRGVVFFDTYVGAAAELVRRGLLEPAPARRVLEVARQELEAIPFRRPETREARRIELEHDAAALEATLA